MKTPDLSRKPRKWRKRVTVAIEGPSRTKQAFASECDINRIMARYQKTGVLPDLIKTNPQYGDFSDPKNYQDALNLVIRANDQFAALSSHIRERFSNDPQKFLEFTSNPKNAAEMVTLGLAVKRQQRSNDDDESPAKANPSKKGVKKSDEPVGE